ncbi:MAG: GtrA family protein [Rhizobiaceae bacterium]
MLRSPGLVALLLAALTLLPAAANGSLAVWPANNDSMMRLVQIRDLIAGQGWYDYTQYRMGLDGGFVMHWSRIVDLPVAAMIMVVKFATGSAATGELIAGIVWPTLLLASSLWALMGSARVLGGEQALFPSALIGAISLYSIGIFAPGALDHHNLQLTLCLLGLLAILRGPSSGHGLAAGAAMALTMAIGMETLPMVVAACGGIAATYLLVGRCQAPMTAGFGLGFASVSLAAYVATVGPTHWLEVHCDAFSVAQLSIAAIGGLGLAATTALPLAGRTRITRLVALGALGAVLAVLVAGAYPQCLADPYAGLDARLQTLWLSAIGEAQPVASVWLNDPVMFAKYYATPLAALAVLGAAMLSAPPRRAQAMTAVFLAVAVLVSFWQVRGGNFAVAFAAVPLAAWVAEKRVTASADRGLVPTLAMVLAWVVSLNACWTMAAKALNEAAGPAVAAEGRDASSGARASGCYGARAQAALATLETGTVLAVSNLGPAVLKYTPHRVLAGPYHRNIAGNIATLDALLGAPEAARQVLRKAGVDLIAHCPGDDESGVLARAAPDGLLAALMRNDPPSWLTPVHPGAETTLTVYRVTLK